jgi:hypothetical protein
VFNLYQTDKLKAWKDFRDTLEVSQNPFADVAEFWAKAPFVNRYLDPYRSNTWPDPWKLILDNQFDDLAIALGMCYTLQLTSRFKDSKYEIHMSMSPSETRHILVIDDSAVLNWEYRSVVTPAVLPDNSIKIWSS